MNGAPTSPSEGWEPASTDAGALIKTNGGGISTFSRAGFSSSRCICKYPKCLSLFACILTFGLAGCTQSQWIRTVDCETSEPVAGVRVVMSQWQYNLLTGRESTNGGTWITDTTGVVKAQTKTKFHTAAFVFAQEGFAPLYGNLTEKSFLLTTNPTIMGRSILLLTNTFVVGRENDLFLIPMGRTNRARVH